MAAPPGADAGLVRAIGARRLAALIVNVTVGAGIFVLPAAAARGLGAAAPFAYLACALAMALIVACMAAAGSRVAITGGIYAYAERAFGPFVGLLAGTLYWTSVTLGGASVGSAFVDSLAVLWPGVGRGAPRFAILLATFGGLAWINVRGVAVGGRLVEAVTVAKLLPLAVLVVAGFWVAPVDPRSWLPLPPASSVGQTALVLLFAFVGIEVALVPGGEIRDQARTVPRAVFFALAFTTLLYLAIQAAAQGVLGASLADYDAAPLAETAARLIGPAGRLLVLAGAAVSMFGYLSGDMLGSPRVLFAFGRDGVLPRAFARVHPRFHTPWIAIVVHAGLVTALAGTSGFTQLAILTNVATLWLYLACIASAWRLQARNVRSDGPPLVLPAGPLIPIAAAALVVWLLAQATRLEHLVTAAVLATAVAGYLLRARAGGASTN